MKLPRYTASTVARGTGLVRAQDIGALTNTGDAQFRAIEGAGRAIGGAADTGFKAYMNRQALDDEIESGKATQRVQESWNKAEEEAVLYQPGHDMPLPDDPKYLETLRTFGVKERDEYLQRLLNDIEKDASKVFSGIKNKSTKEALIQQYNAFYADRAKRLKGTLSIKLSEYQIDEMSKLAEAAASNGDMEISDFYVDQMDKYGLIKPAKATALKKAYRELSTKEEVTRLYRNGFYDEARKELEKSSLSEQDKEDLDDEIDQDEKDVVLEFESGINNDLVKIDNTPNMTQADFNAQAADAKKKILTFPHITGTQRKRMLSDLVKWKRGTNEIDYAKILSLNQEMDAAQRSGIVDPFIKDRITSASLGGAFGGRNKGGQKTYGDMIRRFDKLRFDERAQSIEPIVKDFERYNFDQPRLLFLFHEMKNKIMAENPDMTPRELFIRISGLSESYSIMAPDEITRRMKKEEADKVMMVSPDGKLYEVPFSKKQLFLDNGYTEK